MKSQSIKATAAACLLVGLAILLACDGKPVQSLLALGDFRLEGVLIADHDGDMTTGLVAVRLDDSTAVADADVLLGPDTMLFLTTSFVADSIFVLVEDSATHYPIGDLQVHLKAFDRFEQSVPSQVLEPPSIINVDPPTRLLQGLDPVRVEWTASDNAGSYVVAAAPRNPNLDTLGYAAYVTSLTTLATIPPEAFSPSPGPDPDTGWYDLYVYALIGAPDSLLSAQLLPVPLPTQLSDNISQVSFGGHFGTITVSRHDSIRVVLQP